MKGFSSKWCQWIEQFVTKGSVGIKVNDDIGRYFQTKKRFNIGGSLATYVVQYSGRYDGTTNIKSKK
jgi:hypothetical protein